MDKANKRKTKRVEFSSEAKIRFLDEDKEMTVSVKDVTVTGARVIIAGRIVKINAHLEIKMRLNERYIQCKGRIAWALMLRPGLGNISVFDVGIEFTKMNPGDRAFLEKLFG